MLWYLAPGKGRGVTETAELGAQGAESQNWLLTELKRRNVWRAAAGYCAAGWLLTEVTATLTPAFDLPPMLLRGVVVLAFLGFFPAMALAWTYDYTSEGIRRTPPQHQARNRRVLAALTVAAAVLALALAVAAFMSGRRSLPGGDRPVLAVLPFADMSPRRDQGFLAEGLAEEVMGLLSGDPNLRIIGRTSAWRFAGSSDLAALRSALGASYLLEGSVRSEGEQIRVTVRLIDTSTGAEIWGETFDRPTQDVFDLQEEIASAAADRLRGTFAAAFSTPGLESIRTSQQVYNLYLSAKSVARRRSYESALKAQGLLTQALREDPNYAPAHALMVQVLASLEQSRPSGMQGFGPDERKRALAHAERAVELAPHFAEAHVALAMALGVTPESERALRRALELDPNNFHAWNILGLRQVGCRPSEAVESFRKAASIEPLLPGARQNLITSYLDLGQRIDAEEALMEFVESTEDQIDEARLQMEFSFWTGRIAQSVSQARRGLQLQPHDPQFAIYLAYGLRFVGEREAGIAALPARERGVVGAYWQGNYAAAASEAQKLGDRIWEMGFIAPAAIKSFVHDRRHSTLLQTIEARGGVNAAAPLCNFHLFAPSIFVGLREAGKPSLAAPFLSRGIDEHRLRVRNGFSGANARAVAATFLAAHGNVDAALGELEAAVDEGWLGQGDPHFTGLADPAFNALRAHRRFIVLQKRIATAAARERRRFAELDLHALAATSVVRR
jgi:TolB-like protein/Flp pilus assembly protein TadD